MSLAPSALRMAISLLFSVTIKSNVQMMQKLATSVAIERMTNVATRSSLSALKRLRLSSFQSRTLEVVAIVDQRLEVRAYLRDALGVVGAHLDRG